MKKKIFLLNFLLIIIILTIPISLITQEKITLTLNDIKELFLSKELGEVAMLHHELESENFQINESTHEDKIKIVLKKIEILIESKLEKNDPILFSKIFGEKPNYNMIRSGTKGMAVIALYLAENKKYKKSLNLIKYIFSFSLAMANDSINYDVDGTGSLLEYMISISLFNITSDICKKIIKKKDILQEEASEFRKFIVNIEKSLPGVLLIFKSEYGFVKKMIKELKKHEIGFLTYIERETFNKNSKGSLMDFYIIEAIREIDDAAYVYDLFLDDALFEMEKFYLKLYSLNDKSESEIESILFSIEGDLMRGKICRNFLSMICIPNLSITN
jgi:hypothetical protein